MKKNIPYCKPSQRMTKWDDKSPVFLSYVLNLYNY